MPEDLPFLDTPSPCRVDARGSARNRAILVSARCVGVLVALVMIVGAGLASGENAPTVPNVSLAPTALSSIDDAKGGSPVDEATYCGRQLGSWFYCERPSPSPDPETFADDQKDHAPPEIAEFQAYQKELEMASTVATWRPTPANVERYIRLQKIGLDKSSLFSDEWRRIIWQTPDLDYTNQRPTMALAKTEFDDERTSDRDIFLRGVAQEVGVFYVYSGTCGPCRIASPIIKAFSDRYGVPVKVISTDGALNPVFGRTMADRGQLEGWGINGKITPALLIYQAPTRGDRNGEPRQLVVGGGDGHRMVLRRCAAPNGCLTYLGAGVMSVEDIAERFFVLLSKDPGTDY